VTTGYRALLAICFVIVQLVVPHVTSVAAFKYLQEGMKAPAVSGKDVVDGKKISTAETGDEDLVTCVAFWATWSPRSLQLMTDLKELSVRLADQPFKVIAVNVDSQGTTPIVKDRVHRFVSELDPPFSVIMDQELSLFYEFGVVAVPSMAILDADGVVLAAPSGYSRSRRAELPKTIETALGLRTPEDDEPLIAETGYRPNPRASRYYNLAVKLTNQRNYESALAKVNTASELDTFFSAPLNLRGHIQLQLGNVDAALESFHRAVALDSSSVSARAGLGRAFLEATDTTAALEQLETALKMEPAYPAALLDLGRCLAARQETERALAVLGEAIELNPRDPELYYHLGRVHNETGRNAEAVKAYRAALRMLFPHP
jgi:Flp pilus assembly protein TadD